MTLDGFPQCVELGSVSVPDAEGRDKVTLWEWERAVNILNMDK